jgi:hypothetical protein
MKKILFLTSLLALVFTMSLVSCDKDDEDGGSKVDISKTLDGTTWVNEVTTLGGFNGIKLIFGKEKVAYKGFTLGKEGSTSDLPYTYEDGELEIGELSATIDVDKKTITYVTFLFKLQ